MDTCKIYWVARRWALRPLPMLTMLALGATAYTLPPPGASVRPVPGVANALVPATELGGMIHFPAKLGAAGWPEAEAALDRLKTTLGANAYVRWDLLWHESNWNPDAPTGYARASHIVGLLARRGLRSLVVITPHPWPGSVWDGAPTNRDWGAPKPEWFAKIALRYRESVEAYRSALAANGMSEAANAAQWGNEPAAGHPGGNGQLPKGTWSGHSLWRALHAKDPDWYGQLQVISPALSMLDSEARPTEVATSRVPNRQDWTAPVDRRAMHFRFYRPTATSPEGYATAYVAELASRAAYVQDLAWPTGSPSKTASRRDGLWVTEGYVASGDSPEPRGAVWRAVLAKIRRGVPNVRVFIAYRFHPEGGPGGLDWRIPLSAQFALNSP